MINEKKYLIIGVPILFLMGALFHFLYDFFDSNVLISLIANTNESIWEHSKMILLPMTIYWLIYLFINKDLDKNNWIFNLLISLITSILSMFLIYYFYTYALNIKEMWLDISLLFISLFIGHLTGYHIYKYNNFNINYKISLILIILIFTLYFITTFYPPDFPLFISN